MADPYSVIKDAAGIVRGKEYGTVGEAIRKGKTGRQTKQKKSSSARRARTLEARKRSTSVLSKSRGRVQETYRKLLSKGMSIRDAKDSSQRAEMNARMREGTLNTRYAASKPKRSKSKKGK